MSMRFAVLYGSNRGDRQGIKAARFMVRQLQARGHQAELLDALELELPFLDKMFKEYPEGEAPAGMQRAHDVLAAADGFVVVGGEWNHSIPPGLKNLLDHFQSEFHFKPAGICTYSAGPFAGVRAAPHYRVILGELGMVTPSIMFAVSRVGPSFDDDGNDLTGDYERRAGRFLDELVWYAEALAAKRPDGTPF
ncbi:MAG: NADPH-dependent FMN reductase [Thermoplasmatota archaeon]